MPSPTVEQIRPDDIALWRGRLWAVKRVMRTGTVTLLGSSGQADSAPIEVTTPVSEIEDWARVTAKTAQTDLYVGRQVIPTLEQRVEIVERYLGLR